MAAGSATPAGVDALGMDSTPDVAAAWLRTAAEVGVVTLGIGLFQA
jgi:hypothetical protein